MGSNYGAGGGGCSLVVLLWDLSMVLLVAVVMVLE